MNAVVIFVLIYVLIQIGIGVYLSRRIHSQEDYLLAGRKLGYLLGTFTIFATWFGSETCIGSAAQVYEEGIFLYSAEPFGYGLALIFMGAVFAIPLWRMKLTTLADLFRVRYSVAVERVATTLMIPSSMFWGAAQVLAFGTVLAQVSGWPVEWGITIAAVSVVVYTVFGGLLADSVSDVLQGCVLIAGLVLMLIMVVWKLGGPAEAIAAINPERVRLFDVGEMGVLETINRWMVPICGSVIAQELASRVIATRSAGVARNAALLAGTTYIVVGMIPVFLALVGAEWFADLEDAGQILPLMAQELLPTALYVMFAGALISAILSTIDSVLLVASSLVTQNFIVSFKPDLSDRMRLHCTRIGVVAFGMIAYVFALYAEGVIDLVLTASSFASAGIFTIVVFGLFTRYGGPVSAIVALVAGITAYVFNTYVLDLPYAYLAAVVTAMSLYVAVAWFEPAANPMNESGTE